MPTEYERSSNTVTTLETVTIQHMEPNTYIDKERNEEMSATTTNGHNDSGSSSSSSGGRKTSITSPDPTAYVAKARSTRPTPPPPSYNPMQFVQIKPCNLYQTAQQQLKKAEEVKKIKEIKKEEPEDWQNNLDNWKSSRRKRVEHIIDRVVEVKKLELEEHDRSRRKSKTFSEMIEERGERGVRVGRTKLASLAVYNEDETNDLSDLGIGTSSASGKSSLSEDYDNNSVMSDNADLEKVLFDNSHPQNSTIREYVSSPGYDTSSSTAPASSPDPCEYTYEGAIQDYKQRVSRATAGSSSSIAFKLLNNKTQASKKSTAELRADDLAATAAAAAFAGFDLYPARRGSKIEERLIGFEVSSPNDSQDLLERNEKKVDVPKIDISKRKEIFEQHHQAPTTHTNSYAEPKLLHGGGGGGVGCNGVPRITLRDHFKLPEASSSAVKTHSEVKRLSGDMTSIRDRLLSLEQQKNLGRNPPNDVAHPMANTVVDVPVPPLKERLSSLHNAATKEEVKKPPVVLVDARQLEIMKDEEERNAKQQQQQQRINQTDLVTNQTKTTTTTKATTLISAQSLQTAAPSESRRLSDDNRAVDLDRDDSGIQTSDDVEEERPLPTQEQQLNEAIAALAVEEQQLEQAASAVNQIEAEFAALSNATNIMAATAATTSTTTTTNNEQQQQQPCETMEFSVSSTNDSMNQCPNVCRSSRNGSLNCADSLAGTSDLDDKRINVTIAKESVSVSGSINETRSAPPAATAAPAAAAATACNLNRKSSNEMIHARNLLNIFKETFKNDIEEEEEEQDKENNTITGDDIHGQTPAVTAQNETSSLLPTSSATPNQRINTSQIFKPISKIYEGNCSQLKRDAAGAEYLGPPPPITRPKPLVNSKIVECRRSIGPTGKPPMSPKSTRPPRHPPLPSPPPPPPLPPSSSSARGGNITPNSENPFSINGRVEIFNSKSIQPESDHPSLKPLSPTNAAKKLSQFGQLIANTTEQEVQKCSNNSILFQQQRQQTLNISHERCKDSSQKSVTPISISPQSEATRSAPPGAAHALPLTPPPPLQPQQQTQTQPEIIVCAPPVTVLNPDELPKPNTVKALKSCFSTEEQHCAVVSPKPVRRKHHTMVTTPPPQTLLDQPKQIDHVPDNSINTSSIIDRESSSVNSLRSSTTSSSSTEPQHSHETKAMIHTPPRPAPSLKAEGETAPLTTISSASTPSVITPLVLCTPNDSTLYKLVSSAPQSPCTPPSPSPPSSTLSQQLSPTAVDLCTSFFSNAIAITAPSATAPTATPRTLPPSFNRQQTVEEIMCNKIDVRKVPKHELPSTACSEITTAEIETCDNQNNLLKPTVAQNTSGCEKKLNSKPNSPIVAARAAHSKALIETCEKIIAEERQARSQISASLPTTSSTGPKYSPMAGYKSKIPSLVPRTCCISGSDSMTTADLEAKAQQQQQIGGGGAGGGSSPTAGVRHHHVVETQIKVTTKTPPASPKLSKSTQSNSKNNNSANNSNNKTKTKNIFDFLRRNFGHQTDPNTQTESTVLQKSPELAASAEVAAAATKEEDTLKVDKIITVDNSKFYVACDEATTAVPPPLPLSPAPVNIEITKKTITDEILEEPTIELSLKDEINALLDEEMNKLNLETTEAEVEEKPTAVVGQEQQESKSSGSIRFS